MLTSANLLITIAGGEGSEVGRRVRWGGRGGEAKKGAQPRAMQKFS